MRKSADVTVQNEGTILLVRPTTALAAQWLRDNTDGTWFGASLAVEPRYLNDLVDGIVRAGFTVGGA